MAAQVYTPPTQAELTQLLQRAEDWTAADDISDLQDIIDQIVAANQSVSARGHRPRSRARATCERPPPGGRDCPHPMPARLPRAGEDGDAAVWGLDQHHRARA